MILRVVVLIHWILLGTVAASSSYEGHKVYRVVPTQGQLEQLKRFEDVDGYDIWSRSWIVDSPVDIMIAPREQDNFDRFLALNRMCSQVLIEDVQKVFDAEKSEQKSDFRAAGARITFDQYYTHPEINAYLDEMAATYPNLASVEVIGKSTEGRDLKVIKISRGGNNPIIWIDAGIHAREWIAPAMALYIINQLLENPANSALLDGVDWHILPVVNPDGYQWTHTDDRLWRKTRSKIPTSKCMGVDPNRNWDYHWNDVGASPLACSEIYAGPAPFSEPENAAVRDYINLYKRNMKLYLTLHSYGSFILYPWGWTSALPTDWQQLDSLAREAEAAQRLAGGPAYEVGSSTNVLYAASGGSDDWAKGVAGIDYSFTIELPGGGADGFDLPPSEILATVTPFFEAVRVFGEFVHG